jgi:hypothetical protein
MRVSCKNFEVTLKRADDPGVSEALAEHAAACAGCGERLTLWNEISEAAPSLRKHEPAPGLWPRIQQTLAAESLERCGRSGPDWFALGVGAKWRWRAALAALIVISVPVVFIVMRNSQVPPATQRAEEQEKRLLTEQALQDIEASEAAYIRSIDRLSELVEPKLDTSTTSLMLNYREKLMIIDSAIAELRANIERNRFNAHIRRELIAIYREKQHTLESLMRENDNEQR